MVGPPPIERSRGLAIGAGIGLVVIALSWGIFDGPLWGGGFFLSPLLFIAALVARLDPDRPEGQRGRRGRGRSRAGGVLATILLAFAAFIGLVDRGGRGAPGPGPRATASRSRARSSRSA